jgi:hypothetical protein
MATITTLVSEGRLVRYEPSLPRPVVSERMIYMTPHFQDWAEDDLKQRKRSKGTYLSPFYQLIDRFDAFCRGESFEVNHMFKMLLPTSYGVWEIKTVDVRIFGYFAQKDCFIAVDGQMKSALRDQSRYQKHIGNVVQIRNRLGLHWLKGIEYGDVISLKN